MKSFSKKPIFALVAIAVVLSSISGAHFQSEPLMTVVDARILGYFEKLDYESPAMVAEMPKFEAMLADTAEAAFALPDSDPYLRENALIFIYAALYLDNCLEAHRLGKMSFAQLTQERRFSPAADEASEIRAREDRILAYVDRAGALLPNDIRMSSWVIGMKIKHVGPQFAADIIKIAGERRDTFSLISALTVTRNVPLSRDQEQVLEKLVRKFTSLTSPCFSGKTKSQCHSTELAPFAAQTGVVMLADYRLKMAERATSGRQRKLGRFFARILYNSTGMVWMKDSTPQWRNAGIIPERVALTRDEGFSAKAIDDYRQSQHGQAIYQCTSCHAPAVRPKDARPPPPPVFIDGF